MAKQEIRDFNDFTGTNSQGYIIVGGKDASAEGGKKLLSDISPDLTNYYTKSETSGVNELSSEFSHKLDSSAADVTYLTQSSADILYYPMSGNPNEYLVKISADNLYAPMSATGALYEVAVNHYISGNGTTASPVGLKNDISIDRLIFNENLIGVIPATSSNVSYSAFISPSGIVLKEANANYDGITANSFAISASSGGNTVSITWYDLIRKVNALTAL